MNQNNNIIKTPAPIALFVYNRLEHTKKTVEALQKNTLAHESKLFIFSDGPCDVNSQSKVQEVRNYLKTIEGFKKIEIIEREINQGLAQSIIYGVGEIINRFGTIIVIEDDLVTSPYFLEYMNDGLQLYEKEDQVISIHGYVYPVKESLPETFFLRGADCWGWATWKRGWSLFEPDGKKLLAELEKSNQAGRFDFDGAYDFSGMLKRQIAGKNNSWAIRYHASAFLKNRLTLYPGISLVDNIGNDESGTHRSNSHIYETTVSNKKISVGNIEIKENEEARGVIVKYFKSYQPNIVKRTINFIRHKFQ